MRMKIVSRAKINLTLEVIRRRHDGYHEIDSVVQVIDLADELVLETAAPGVVELEIAGGGAPTGPDNSVHCACRAFFEATGTPGGARCTLRKRIPMQSGLGGAGSNAAAAIVALDGLYETRLRRDQLADIAARVSSDAPLFVYGGTARIRGRGETVAPLADAPDLHLVIVKPELGISTAWAYDRLDTMGPLGPKGASDRAEEAVRSCDRAALVGSLQNDFGSIICESFPEIGEAGSALIESGAEAVSLTGSGSSVFGVFGSHSRAHDAAEALGERLAGVYLARNFRSEATAVV